MQVVATAGHVDHGKSTLLRAITGMEPDRWREEQERGLTIDLGFVWTDLPTTDGESVTVAFVDVPGHERFIANMLAGAGAVRTVLFVVAADDGWSAQSQEHLDILDLLDVRHGVVAITKAQVAGHDRVESVAEDIRRRIAGTRLATAPIVVTDAVEGTGLDQLTEVLVRELLAAPTAPDRQRPRLWLDRSFTITGAGTIVTGTLHGGALDDGDDVRVLPRQLPARIRGLQALGRSVRTAPPGSRVAVNVGGIDQDDVGRGDALVTSDVDWLVTRRFDAWVRALPGVEIDRPGAWHVHVGSAEVTGTVHPLLGEPIPGGSEGWLRVELDRPLPLASGDRFVLREAGRQATVGGGEVVDPDPGDPVRGVDRRLERTEQLETVLLADDRLTSLVTAAGGARPMARALAAAQVTRDNPLPATLERVADHLVHVDALARWTAALQQRLVQHHRDAPESPGLDRVSLARVVEDTGCPPRLAPAIVDHAAATGQLFRSGSHYADPAQADRLRDVSQDRAARLLALLDAEPFAPPRVEDAAREAGVDYQQLQRLEQAGRLVRLGDLAFSVDAVTAAIDRLRELEEEVGPFTAAQAKDAWGTTRRYAIPLLEHLDAVGVTDFDGRLRRLV